ncbi:MAG TPA: SulP family inorganic anion transporter [Actinomycetota bacterium]|nr:SulP family inorganic anion transporter [Actinomycetota bacterium]
MGAPPTSERRRAAGPLATVAAGAIIGAVETVLAVAFAAFVFGGYLLGRLADGIGLYLAAAAITLAVLAIRAGRRGVVGSVQDAAVAVLAGAAGAAATKAVTLERQARASGALDYEAPDTFLTVVAATLVVTLLCGVVFLALGTFKLGNLVRFVPYPVVGGFLAGTGWLLFKGGIFVASGISLPTIEELVGEPQLFSRIEQLVREQQLLRWVPALVFGAVMLLAVRRIKRPLVLPLVLGVGLVVFALGMVLTGSSLDEAREGRWLLGPFDAVRLWEPWTLRSLSGADWSTVLAQWAGILTAVFVASLAILFNISGSELVLHRDLDTNEELRDAGYLNLFTGGLGGPPAYHALSLSALADRMSVNARFAGLIAALVPLAGVIFGASVIELIPRIIVGGVLVFLGLAFIVEWVWDKRKTLPPLEYGVVLVILATIVATDFLTGVVLGLVLAVVLFAVSYGRIELVREVAFGLTYHSNVDRPAAERAALRERGELVQILRVNGFMFFGSANGLLERIRKRLERGPVRFLVIDLRRATGVDSSAAESFVKVIHLAESRGFELVFAGASEAVREQLARGGVTAIDGLVWFEPDLDRGLQRCEDGLLAEATPMASAGSGAGALPDGSGDGRARMPEGLAPHLERVELDAGTVLLRQDEPPGDVFVLESGLLEAETETPDGTRMRLRTMHPGVVVGEIALYTGVSRTADVVTAEPSVVLRLRRSAIERIEAEDPRLASALHRWLAWTVANRLGDTMRTFDALLD